MKTLKEIRLKSGTVIPAGTECTVAFNQTALCVVSPFGFPPFRTKCGKLPHWFKDIEGPNMEQLEGWVNDGVCESVLGYRVEPDGYDAEGSPSWLIALGMI